MTEIEKLQALVNAAEQLAEIANVSAYDEVIKAGRAMLAEMQSAYAQGVRDGMEESAQIADDMVLYTGLDAAAAIRTEAAKTGEEL